MNDPTSEFVFTMRNGGSQIKILYRELQVIYQRKKMFKKTEKVQHVHRNNTSNKHFIALEEHNSKQTPKEAH